MSESLQKVSNTISSIETIGVVVVIGGVAYLFLNPDKLFAVMEWILKGTFEEFGKLVEELWNELTDLGEWGAWETIKGTAKAIEPATQNIAANKPKEPGGLWTPSFGSFGAR